jgi:SpoVK/Ycf46/Vps4 family AAA+-type ATPase
LTRNTATETVNTKLKHMPNPNGNPIPQIPPDFYTPEHREFLRREFLRREFLRRSNDHDGHECEVPADASVADDNRNPRRRDRRQQELDVGILIETTERDDLGALVLHDEAKADLIAGLRAIELRAELERVWNIGQVEPQGGRCILNFYGDPGTGKTSSALAVARRLVKPLYKVDYSAVISKYLGDTAKHIAAAFKRAAELEAVLFFDEADSLLSKRVDMDASCATSINQNRNVLMQCLDSFDGVVIMTTNLFANYDEALLRRIARHIEFKLPNLAMRKRILELHLPNRERVEADLLEVAKASKGLSGGDLKNVCLNSIYAASVSDDPEQWKMTQAVMLAEVEKVKAAKERHTRPPCDWFHADRRARI